MAPVLPKQRLGEVLKVETDAVPVNPSETYKFAGVYSFGRGLFVRGDLSGVDTTYKRFHRLHAGMFVMSQPKGWEGALARVSEDFDGLFLSPVYPTFNPDTERLDVRYLEWYFKQKHTWDALDRLSKGMGARRNSVYPDMLLSLEIPLPPLSEQRRIVTKIERLAAKIEEARALKTISQSDLISLTSASYGRAFEVRRGWQVKSVSDFCDKPQYGYTASASQEQIGPHLLRITDIQDGRVNWLSVPFCCCPEPSPYLLKENDILFARTGATTGKSFLIKDCPSAVFASYLIRLRIQDSVLPEYLYAFFQTPAYWQQITDEMKGTGQPNCNGRKLANVKVPIPPIQEQRRIVKYFDGLQAKVDRLKALQAKTAAELDALLPSILDRAFKGEL